MYRTGRTLHVRQVRPYPRLAHPFRSFSGFSSAQACNSSQATGNHKSKKTVLSRSTPLGSALSVWNPGFWACRSTWKRAGINTLRCLVGCTIGDFSALWVLQTYYPELSMSFIMGASSRSSYIFRPYFKEDEATNEWTVASGITTSIMVETLILRRGADQLSWPMAVRTAMGMSMVSMLAMETAENIVDYHLTGGVVAIGDPQFWMAAAASMAAGYLAPLPYNYMRLRRYGKACH
ncbi:hypothetical protein BDV59DRAFT_99879 [Aspergillus ambiguus]|uniref:DUF4396 domain-containing protein n=1 Tax=Aspergillus ambiguus TaxID=176160 RepID=UPI003CCD1053